jgi:hypothetical protein
MTAGHGRGQQDREVLSRAFRGRIADAERFLGDCQCALE